MDSVSRKSERAKGPFMDDDIIRAACNGCPKAQEQVIRHYSPLVRTIIRSTALSSFHIRTSIPDEDDLTQIVLIGMWEMLGAFQ